MQTEERRHNWRCHGTISAWRRQESHQRCKTLSHPRQIALRDMDRPEKELLLKKTKKSWPFPPTTKPTNLPSSTHGIIPTEVRLWKRLKPPHCDDVTLLNVPAILGDDSIIKRSTGGGGQVGWHGCHRNVRRRSHQLYPMMQPSWLDAIPHDELFIPDVSASVSSDRQMQQKPRGEGSNVNIIPWPSIK